jgi:hypothetical protein
MSRWTLTTSHLANLLLPPSYTELDSSNGSDMSKSSRLSVNPACRFIVTWTGLSSMFRVELSSVNLSVVIY